MIEAAATSKWLFGIAIETGRDDRLATQRSVSFRGRPNGLGLLLMWKLLSLENVVSIPAVGEKEGASNVWRTD